MEPSEALFFKDNRTGLRAYWLQRGARDGLLVHSGNTAGRVYLTESGKLEVESGSQLSATNVKELERQLDGSPSTLHAMRRRARAPYRGLQQEVLVDVWAAGSELIALTSTDRIISAPLRAWPDLLLSGYNVQHRGLRLSADRGSVLAEELGLVIGKSAIEAASERNGEAGAIMDGLLGLDLRVWLRGQRDKASEVWPLGRRVLSESLLRVAERLERS